MRPRLVLALLAVLLAVPGTADAATGKKRGLWATVNVCDSPRSPNAMGVRANMPGNGTRQRMYMRFSAQWYSKSRDRWLAVEGARSPWVLAGSAIYRYRQGGWTFRFPNAGFLVRGVVRYEWRKRRKKGRGFRVVRRAKRVTRSDPGVADRGEGIARATCYIS